jgi:DNA ligase-1
MVNLSRLRLSIKLAVLFSSRIQDKVRKGINNEVPIPMLAHDFCKRGKSVQFPCYVQRKYDGTRCVSVPESGLFSRNRKAYPHLEHIVTEINKLPYILDGELYSDTLTFQEIVGIVKKETLKDGDKEKQMQIKFHVYDIVNDMPYEERYKQLKALFKGQFKHLVLVQTNICESEEKMKELHGEYVAEGYEGIMLRNKSGLYKNARSVDLQKFKTFQDEEFEVIGFKEGEGQEAGCVLWICNANNDVTNDVNNDVTNDVKDDVHSKTFACRPRGTREDRIELFKNGSQYIGKKLTVRFQELTDDKIPRFPVGIAFRDYE